MSGTFRILQMNHLPDKDVIMEVPDVERVNEISRKRTKQFLLRTKITPEAGLHASSTRFLLSWKHSASQPKQPVCKIFIYL